MRGPELRELTGLFPGGADDFAAEVIAAGEVPEPYHTLLVHHHHMTVTVEKFYRGPVDVRPLEVRHDGDLYCRKILLVLRETGAVVQFGIVRIRLDCCSEPVREAILSRKTPLGRILIQHKVLRHIRPTAYLRVEPGAPMREWFGLGGPRTTYGRLGVIFYDHRPAIEVLEILAPVPGDTAG
ncbi:MAG TPA: hypothetical protein VIL46_10540 [Gemmataceae bacterium]